MRKALVTTIVAAVALVLGAPASGQVSAAAQLGGGKPFVVALEGPGGTGTALITVNPGTGQVCYRIDVTLTEVRDGVADVPQEPGPGVGNAHLHFTATGGIALHLDTLFTPTGDRSFTASGCVTGDRALLLDIIQNPESYYLNVHTLFFPGGAVSGTL